MNAGDAPRLDHLLPPSPERDGGGSVAAMGVLEGLRDACPALALHTDGAALAAGGLDAMRPSRGRPEFAALATRPLAVAEPASAAEVAALVRWATGARVPLVARGGGSGLDRKSTRLNSSH